MHKLYDSCSVFGYLWSFFWNPEWKRPVSREILTLLTLRKATKKTRKQQFSCRKNRIQHDTTGFPNTFLMEGDQHILWISSHLIIWNHVIGVCCGPLLKSQFLTSSESENARVEGVQASSALQFSLLSLSSKLPSLKLYCNSPWKWMVGRLLSWDGLFSGAMLVSGGGMVLLLNILIQWIFMVILVLPWLL